METKSLKCILNTDELLRKSAEMAELQRQKELVEAEKKDANAAFRERLDEIEVKLSEVAREVRDKAEFRDVMVHIEKDWGARELVEVREDTGEVVNRKPMNQADMQTDLPLDTKKKAPAAKGNIPQPNSFAEADVGQVWKSSNLGELTITAKAKHDVVVEYQSADGEVQSTRLFEDMWATHEMQFVRFCSTAKSEPAPVIAIASLTSGTPREPEADQFWEVNGQEVLVKAIEGDAREILVEYPDKATSYFSRDEWTAAGAIYKRTKLRAVKRSRKK